MIFLNNAKQNFYIRKGKVQSFLEKEFILTNLSILSLPSTYLYDTLLKNSTTILRISSNSLLNFVFLKFEKIDSFFFIKLLKLIALNRLPLILYPVRLVGKKILLKFPFKFFFKFLRINIFLNCHNFTLKTFEKKKVKCYIHQFHYNSKKKVITINCRIKKPLKLYFD